MCCGSEENSVTGVDSYHRSTPINMLKYNRVNHGCCLTLMNSVPDESVDMILCDLPYGSTASKWDQRIDLDSLWKQYNRITKRNSNIILFSSQPFTTDLINSNRKGFKYCWYWIKNQGTNFYHAKRMPIRKVEEICIFGKGKYNPQITDGHVKTNSATGTSSGKVYYGDNIRNCQGGKTTRYPVNVLDFPCVDNYSRLHSAEKPVQLLEYLIRTYTNEGDVVLDNCSGSGSTGVACLNTSRGFIGIEIDIDYVRLANKRIISN